MNVDRMALAFAVIFIPASFVLSSVHPETPSPLAGEGWGEGEQNGTLRNSEPLPPPPFPPPSRGRRKMGFPDENYLKSLPPTGFYLPLLWGEFIPGILHRFLPISQDSKGYGRKGGRSL